jgi:hypothetical protein
MSEDSDLLWATAETALFNHLLDKLNPQAPEATPEDPTPARPPAVWVSGKNAFLGWLPAAMPECWMLATGGAPGDNTHNAGTPPDDFKSGRMGGVVLARFRSRRAAMSFITSVWRLFTAMNVGNVGVARALAHPDIDPEWTTLPNDDKPSLTWIASVPLEIVYGDVVGA